MKGNLRRRTCWNHSAHRAHSVVARRHSGLAAQPKLGLLSQRLRRHPAARGRRAAAHGRIGQRDRHSLDHADRVESKSVPVPPHRDAFFAGSRFRVTAVTDSFDIFSEKQDIQKQSPEGAVPPGTRGTRSTAAGRSTWRRGFWKDWKNDMPAFPIRRSARRLRQPRNHHGELRRPRSGVLRFGRARSYSTSPNRRSIGSRAAVRSRNSSTASAARAPSIARIRSRFAASAAVWLLRRFVAKAPRRPGWQKWPRKSDARRIRRLRRKRPFTLQADGSGYHGFGISGRGRAAASASWQRSSWRS